MSPRAVLTALLVGLLAAGSATAGNVSWYDWDGVIDIPDNDPGNFVGPTISVPSGPGADTIVDVDVDLVIEHTWQGDLIVELELAGGPRVPLLHRAGDSDDVGAGFSANNLGDPATGAQMFLDDEAAGFYDSSPPDGIGAIPDPGIDNVTDSWIPYGSQASGLTQTLSAFDGLSRVGDWTLWVSDNAAGDTGAILHFSLHIETIPEPASLSLLAFCGLALCASFAAAA